MLYVRGYGEPTYIYIYYIYLYKFRTNCNLFRELFHRGWHQYIWRDRGGRIRDDDTATNRDNNSVLTYYNMKTAAGNTRWSDASSYVLSVCAYLNLPTYELFYKRWEKKSLWNVECSVVQRNFEGCTRDGLQRWKCIVHVIILQ